MDLPGHPYSDPLQIALQRELHEGEKVLWNSRPLGRINQRAFALYLFAVPWTAFALFWTAMAYAGISSMQAEGIGLLGYAFPLFGVPFIVIGLAMLAPPFMPLLFARKTLYAVTSRRMIKLQLGRRLITRSVEAARIGPIERSEGPEGAGSLKIVIGSNYDSDGDPRTDYFEIGEVAQVIKAENSIRVMLEGSGRAGAPAKLSS